jgi:hypothetical protein
MSVEEVRAKWTEPLNSLTNVLNSGSTVCNCGFKPEGAFLREITNYFLNCVNKKIYSISLVILVSDLLCGCDGR